MWLRSSIFGEHLWPDPDTPFANTSTARTHTARSLGGCTNGLVLLQSCWSKTWWTFYCSQLHVLTHTVVSFYGGTFRRSIWIHVLKQTVQSFPVALVKPPRYNMDIECISESLCLCACDTGSYLPPVLFCSVPKGFADKNKQTDPMTRTRRWDDLRTGCPSKLFPLPDWNRSLFVDFLSGCLTQNLLQRKTCCMWWHTLTTAFLSI